MKKSKWLLGGVVLITLYYLFAFPTPMDRRAIRRTLYSEIPTQKMALYQSDPSILTSVYTNEPALCSLNEQELETIRFVRQDATVQATQVGILDYWQAYVIWRGQAVEKREAIAQVVVAEGRNEMTYEEQASLLDQTGKTFPVLVYPAPDPGKISSLRGLPILWYRWAGVNQVQVYIREQMDTGHFFYYWITLVKKEGQWLIACP